MCGRYWLDLNEETAELQTPGVKRSGEVLPGDNVPAMCFSRSGKVRTFAMQWGWHLSGGKLLINIKSETAGEKQLFSDSILHRRCLLPMSAYFEWHKRGRDKIKYRISPGSEESCYLAALYRWENETPVFSVLTCAAVEEIAFIHNRMPVIIPRTASENWLGAGEFTVPIPPVMNFSIAL